MASVERDGGIGKGRMLQPSSTVAVKGGGRGANLPASIAAEADFEEFWVVDGAGTGPVAALAALAARERGRIPVPHSAPTKPVPSAWAAPSAAGKGPVAALEALVAREERVAMAIRDVYGDDGDDGASVGSADSYVSADSVPEEFFRDRRAGALDPSADSAEKSVPTNVPWSELVDVKHVNSGSMCSIFICTWRGGPAAIKLVRKDAHDRAVAENDLELELEVLRRVRHPHIIKLLGAGRHPTRGRFLLLEVLSGGTLTDLIQRRLRHATKKAAAAARRPGFAVTMPLSSGNSVNGNGGGGNGGGGSANQRLRASAMTARERLSRRGSTGSLAPGRPDTAPGSGDTGRNGAAGSGNGGAGTAATGASGASGPPPLPLTPKWLAEALGLALDLAQAMHHLHRHAIDGHLLLHRDLKPDNVAFALRVDPATGKEMRVLKLIDFGLAKLLRRRRRHPTHALARYQMTGETGSPRYMAPECHLSQPYNEKADVYSFGMCLWELVELRVPFADAVSLREFRERVVAGGQRPPVGDHWPRRLGQLAAACWHREVDKRPLFDKVQTELGALLADLGASQVAARRQSRQLRQQQPPQQSRPARRFPSGLGWLRGAAGATIGTGGGNGGDAYCGGGDATSKGGNAGSNGGSGDGFGRRPSSFESASGSGGGKRKGSIENVSSAGASGRQRQSADSGGGGGGSYASSGMPGRRNSAAGIGETEEAEVVDADSADEECWDGDDGNDGGEEEERGQRAASEPGPTSPSGPCTAAAGHGGSRGGGHAGSRRQRLVAAPTPLSIHEQAPRRGHPHQHRSRGSGNSSIARIQGLFSRFVDMIALPSSIAAAGGGGSSMPMWGSPSVPSSPASGVPSAGPAPTRAQSERHDGMGTAPTSPLENY